ncbi:MAG TPA: hypothetical protein VEP30_12275 [Chthoniobacterales bacterium]|nr:hypothetical protein [Chthoniobacterales bacterium]
MRRTLTPTIFLVFAGIAFAKLPGQSLITNPTVLQDVYFHLDVAEKAFGKGCKWRVVDTKITKPPKTLGEEKGTGLAVMQWTERWTIDRCGKKVFYTIEFDMRGSAGTIFQIKDETD